ncbi:MAG: branched-chain amino acid aminotransferase, partial [Cytophagaceae bacterium]
QDILFMQLPLLPISWITHLVAIKGGFRLIPSATILGEHDIVYRFSKLMPKVVIADMENAAKIDEAETLLEQQVSLKIIMNGAKDGWTPFEEINNYPEHAIAADTHADDPLFLFFTSGTTGMPKVVTHTHFSYPVGQLTTAAWVGLKHGDVHYNIAQPGWAKFAYSSFFSPWNLGATFFAFNAIGRFVAKDHLAMLEKYKVTTFCAPPTALRMLIQEDLTACNLSLRESSAAGEPLNPEIIEAWKKGTGITIRDGFGQTESSIAVGNMPGSHIKFGSMGKPLFLYDIVIADNDGHEMPVDEEGNICVDMQGKSLGVFAGYHDAPETMSNVFKHGLYYTGDKAYKDADGYLWFVGRDDDVIKSSGYRVGPFEVESAVLEHEAVLESAVVGSPHAVKAAEIKAFIVLTKNITPHRALADDIFAHCRKTLAPYKMPRIIEFVSELPKTISGKIRRVELRATEAEKKAKGEQGEQEYFL